MVSRTNLRCTVVAVSALEDRCPSRGAIARDVLPWADPYVAQLIKNLQVEVRHERRMKSLARHYRPAVATAVEPKLRARFETGRATGLKNCG